MTGPTTSLTLLRGIQQGDRNAWIDFSSRYTEFIFLLLRRRGLNGDEADEGCNDVLKALASSALAKWDSSRGFRPYLRGICGKVALRIRRQRQPFGRQELGGALDGRNGDDGGEYADLVIADHREPDEDLEEEEYRLIVKTALKDLRDWVHRQRKEKEYAALVLSFTEGWGSLAKLAKEFGVPEGTVRSWKSRLLVQLKNYVADCLQDYTGSHWRKCWNELVPGVDPPNVAVPQNQAVPGSLCNGSLSIGQTTEGLRTDATPLPHRGNKRPEEA